MLKRLLKLVLAVFLVEPAVFPASQEKDEFHYASFGASQTAGFGLDGFLPEEFYLEPRLMWGNEPEGIADDGNVGRRAFYSYGYSHQPENAYPNLVGKALQEKFGDSKKVVVDHSEMSGTRARDFDFLINPEKTRDAYFASMVSGIVGAYNAERDDTFTVRGNTYPHKKDATSVSDEMISRIQNADLISYDYGVNDFGAYMLNLAWGTEAYSTDLGQINPKYGEIYETIKGTVEALVLRYAGEYLTNTVFNFVENAANTISYAFVGFVDSFDSSMKKIYELNPDVSVVVVQIQNIYDGLMLDIAGKKLPVGEIIGAVIDMANAYTAYLSPYADKYYYADFGEKNHVEYFIDQIRNWDGTLDTLENMSEFKNSMNVYDMFGVYAESTIKDAIYTKYDWGKLTGVSCYDDVIEELSTYGQYLQDWIQNGINEKEGKCNIMYYSFAKAFQIAAKSGVVSLSNIGGSYTSYLGLITKAQTLRDGWDIDSDFDDYLATVDTEITSFMAEEGTAGNILMLMYNALYACSFFEHPTANGHVEAKEAIIRAYENKINKKANTLNEISSLVDALPDITMEDIKAALETIAAIANKNTEAIEKARAEASELIDFINGYIQKLLPYIVKAKQVYDEVMSTLDELGITDKIYADVIELIAPVKEKLESIISSAEKVVAKATDLAEKSLEELRVIAPEVAAGIDEIAAKVNELGSAIETLAKELVGFVSGKEEYEAGKFAAIDSAIDVIIKVKETMDSVASFAEELSNTLVDMVKDEVKAVYETVRNAIANIKLSIDRFLNSEELAAIKKAVKAVNEMLEEVERFLKEFEPYLSGAKAVVESIAEFAKENITSEELTFIKEELEKAITEAEKVVADVKAAVLKAYEIAKEITSEESLAKVKEAVEKAKVILELALLSTKDAMTMMKEAAQKVVEALPEAIENLKDFIKNAGETYDALRLETSKVILKVSSFVIVTAKFIKDVLGQIIEVKHQIEEIISVVKQKISEIENTVNLIQDITEKVIAQVVAAYNSLPEEVRAIIERAVSNIINRTKGDFALLYSQIVSVIENIYTSPIEEVKAIFSHINQMEIDIVTIIEEGINEAIATVVGGVNYAVITVTVVTPHEIVVTIDNCVKTNTTNLVTTVNNGVEDIIAAIVEEICADPEIDFFQKADEVKEAHDEMLEAKEEAEENAEDAATEASVDVAAALLDLLSKWHLY